MIARRRLCLLALLLAVWMVPTEPALAQESTLDNEPAPTSVGGLDGPLAQAFRVRIREKTLFPTLKRKLEELPSFFSDTELRIHSRSYYFNRRRANDPRARAWAAGGGLAYRSGWYRDLFSMGATLYTSQKIIGRKEEDGTLLLAQGQEGYTVLGQAYAKLKVREHRATFYRQALDLPYVNSQDSRMTPNTFEGYVLRGAFRDGFVEYVGGYIDKMKRRNEDDFTSMSQAAGVAGASDDGMVFGGAIVRPCDGCLIGVVDYHVDDTLNIAYAISDYTYEPSQDWGLRAQGQFTRQASVGADLLTGEEFDTWVVGGRLAASYRSAILMLAFSSTDDEENIRSPYGSYAGYLSLMQSDFNRAGEDAWLVGFAYTFDRWGLPELSGFTNYAQGSNAEDPSTGAGLPDQRTVDVTLDYHVKEGWMRGFWLRTRASVLDIDGADRDAYDFRVILNYDFSVL